MQRCSHIISCASQEGNLLIIACSTFVLPHNCIIGTSVEYMLVMVDICPCEHGSCDAGYIRTKCPCTCPSNII